MKLVLIYFPLCSHAFHLLCFTVNIFFLSKQVTSSISIPHWMRSYCFSSSHFDSSMFCQKTGCDFCRTASRAAGRARLVLLQYPGAEKKEASTLASISSLGEKRKAFNNWLQSCPINTCQVSGSSMNQFVLRSKGCLHKCNWRQSKGLW